MGRILMGPFWAGWQRLTRIQRIAAVVVGGGLVLTAVDTVSLRPLRHRLGALRAEVLATEQRLVASLHASGQADEVARAYEAYRPYVQPAEKPDVELAAVLTEVETAVRDAGMVLLNLKPIAESGESRGTVRVTVEAESTPTQLVQMLARLDGSRRLLKVTEMSLRRMEEGRLRTTLVVTKLVLVEAG